MRICITGGIACGKSLIGGFAAELGVPVREADDICHALTVPGGLVHKRILASFGHEITDANGEINRRALADIILARSEKREQLNSIIHPEARAELESWIAKLAPERTAAVIPLLFEAGWERSWDIIICVGAPAAIQIQRLKARGLSDEEAAAWIGIQMPVAEKMRRADYVVFNSGHPECAKGQTLEIFRDIEKQAEK